MLTDEALLLDAVGIDVEEMTHFGFDMALDISPAVWRLVDEIKRLRPGWP
jgi:hypothetical protein